MVRVDIQVIKIFDSAAGISTSVESGAMSVEAIYISQPLVMLFSPPKNFSINFVIDHILQIFLVREEVLYSSAV
jgi:hypothetical protein